jgi:hypothetical protein
VKYAAGSGTTPLLVITKHIDVPEGIAVDQGGNIFVSNSSSNDITVYDEVGGYKYSIK